MAPSRQPVKFLLRRNWRRGSWRTLHWRFSNKSSKNAGLFCQIPDNYELIITGKLISGVTGKISGVGSIFGKRGQKKFGTKRRKILFLPPLRNFAGGQISVWALCNGNGTWPNNLATIYTRGQLCIEVSLLYSKSGGSIGLPADGMQHSKCLELAKPTMAILESENSTRSNKAN